ncbi:hypothetical protein D3C85_1129240 [compost metagenome]
MNEPSVRRPVNWSYWRVDWNGSSEYCAVVSPPGIRPLPSKWCSDTAILSSGVRRYAPFRMTSSMFVESLLER